MMQIEANIAMEFSKTGIWWSGNNERFKELCYKSGPVGAARIDHEDAEELAQVFLFPYIRWP